METLNIVICFMNKFDKGAGELSSRVKQVRVQVERRECRGEG